MKLLYCVRGYSGDYGDLTCFGEVECSSVHRAREMLAYYRASPYCWRIEFRLKFTLTTPLLRREKKPAPRCATCGALATHSVIDYIQDPERGNHADLGGLRHGCAVHKVTSETRRAVPMSARALR